MTGTINRLPPHRREGEEAALLWCPHCFEQIPLRYFCEDADCPECGGYLNWDKHDERGG